VKTNKEYQAMLKEIDDTKKEISRNEDSALELMDKIEHLGGEVAELEKDLAEKRRKLEEDRKVVQREGDELKGRLDRLEAIRQLVRERVTPELLKKTDFLFHKQAGIAVSAVENGVCGVCHMNIPPQKFIELQRDEEILQCPHCHRFLYWPGHEGYCVTEEDIDAI
jgi:predicted  nucleic acid-binding Zn-ribbon protein